MQLLDVGGHHIVELRLIVLRLDSGLCFSHHGWVSSRIDMEFFVLCDLAHRQLCVIGLDDDLPRHLYPTHCTHAAVRLGHLHVAQHIGHGGPGSGLDLLGHLHHLRVPQLLWHHQDAGGVGASG